MYFLSVVPIKKFISFKIRNYLYKLRVWFAVNKLYQISANTISRDRRINTDVKVTTSDVNMLILLWQH